MKKLAGLVIILAVLILGGYYGMGCLTQRAIKKNVEIMNQTNGLYADVQDYKRGLFCSDAKIKWRLNIPERIVKDANGASQTVAAQEYQLEMPMKIYHGPIIYFNHQLRFGMGYAKTVFPFPAEYNKQFNEQFTKDSIKPQLDLSVFVSYFLKSSVELSIPSFKLTSKSEHGTFDWMGMRSSLSLSSSKDQINGDVAIDGMILSKDDVKVTLGKVTTEYNLHQTASGLYLGDANFNMPSFDVIENKEPLVAVKDLSMSSNSDIEQNLFSTHFSLGLQSVLANKKTYGPGELEVTLRNLDADVLAHINQEATAMQNGTQSERQKAMMAMLPELPKLFSKGAEFEISKLNLKIPEGSINGTLLVSLPKGDHNNPFELIQKVQGNAKLKVPSALVKQLMTQAVIQQLSKQPQMQEALIQQLQAANSATPSQAQPTTEELAAAQADKQINTMLDKALIVASGTDYEIEVTLDQGKFVVNGKPFEPSMLAF